MRAPDVKTLIGEVAARHGITLRSDDPAFALVTVNQLVLEQTMLDLIQRTQEMTAEFDRAGDRLQERAGRVLAGELRKAGAEIRRGDPARFTAGYRRGHAAPPVRRASAARYIPINGLLFAVFGRDRGANVVDNRHCDRSLVAITF